MKKFLALLMVLLSLLGTMTLGASAATTRWSAMTTTSQAYKNSTTEIRGQKMLEKAITVPKNTKKTIKIELSTGAKTCDKTLASYVRFAVWVYDCSTGKRVAKIDALKAGTAYQLPTKLLSNKTYSVQVRPYMSQAAWKVRSVQQINAYLYNAATLFRIVY